jgi:hypothetical protein
MAISPYLILITVILAVTAGFIYYTQTNARKTVRIHDQTAILPEMAEPLPIVTEPPFHLQPIIEEETGPASSDLGHGIGLIPTEEGFANSVGITQGNYVTEGFADMETRPAPANPFMNVLIPEIKYNPERPEAAPVDDPMVKQQLDDMFRTNFFNDPTDVFGKSQDQRQFITMPSTSIPNDRESFMKWCYNIVPQNCKSGGREGCLPGTDGGPIVSLNQEY